MRPRRCIRTSAARDVRLLIEKHALPMHRRREICKFNGVPMRRMGHKPLLLATVEGGMGSRGRLAFQAF